MDTLRSFGLSISLDLHEPIFPPGIYHHNSSPRATHQRGDSNAEDRLDEAGRTGPAFNSQNVVSDKPTPEKRRPERSEEINLEDIVQAEGRGVFPRRSVWQEYVAERELRVV